MLTFDAATHTYTVDGIEYPGITSLLKPLTNYDNVPEFLLKKAGELGTAVHKGVEDFMMDRVIGSLTAEEHVCFSGFPKFWHEHPEWHTAPRIIERPMIHPKLKYAGTPDIILDGVAIIEIKTRLFHKKTDPLQLAAQEALWVANGGIKTSYPKFVLELHKNGTAQLVPASHGQPWPKFRYLVDHYWRCREWEQKIAVWKG